MCLDVDGEVDLLGQPLPAFKHAHGVAQFARPQVRLDVDVVHTEGRAPLQRRLQAVDVRREGQAFDDEVALGGEPREFLGLSLRGPQSGDAVELGGGDDIQRLGQRTVGLAAEVARAAAR